MMHAVRMCGCSAEGLSFGRECFRMQHQLCRPAVALSMRWCGERLDSVLAREERVTALSMMTMIYAGEKQGE